MSILPTEKRPKSAGVYYSMKEEAHAPGFRAQRDRVTLLNCIIKYAAAVQPFVLEKRVFILRNIPMFYECFTRHDQKLFW